MKAHTICLLAVALVGVSACERNQEKPGQTTTTSGETTQATLQQPQPQPAAEAPQQPPQPQAQQETQEPSTPGAPTAAAGDTTKKDECVCPPATTPKKAKKAKTAVQTPQPKEERSMMGTEEPVGTTETTSAESEVPRTTTTTEPTTPATPPTTPRAQQPQEEPYVNHSTVLGDGKSGTYTDGQGTYGGRATWGTGTPKP